MLPNQSSEDKNEGRGEKETWMQKIKLKLNAADKKRDLGDVPSLKKALEEAKAENAQMLDNLLETLETLRAAKEELVYASASSKYLNHEAFALRDQLHIAKREASYLKLKLSDKEKELADTDALSIKEKLSSKEKEVAALKDSLERNSHASYRLTEVNKALEKTLLKEKERNRVLSAYIEDYKRIISKHCTPEELSEEMIGGSVDAIENEQPGSTSFVFTSEDRSKIYTSLRK